MGSEMLDVLGETLGNAFATNLSTVPLVGLCVILVSKNGKAKGLAYALATVFAIGLMVGVFTALGTAADASQSTGEPSTWVSIVKLALGILMVVVGYKSFASRPRSDDDITEPKWFATIDSMSVVGAFAFGALASTLVVKNIPLSISTATDIARADLSGGATVATVIVYAVLGSVLFLVPTILYLVAPDWMAPKLAEMRHWLLRHSAVILAVVLALIGFNFVGKGLQGL
jgi:hypothetical protein